MFLSCIVWVGKKWIRGITILLITLANIEIVCDAIEYSLDMG